MQLAPADTLEFNQQVAELEGASKMQYVTSVERIGMIKGLFQGREEGKLEVALNLRDKFDFTVEKIAEALEMPIDKLNQLLNQSKS